MEQVRNNVVAPKELNINLQQFNNKQESIVKIQSLIRGSLAKNTVRKHQESIVKIQSLLRGSLAKNTAKRERLIRLQEQRDAQNFKIAMFAVSILAIANFHTGGGLFILKTIITI